MSRVMHMISFLNALIDGDKWKDIKWLSKPHSDLFLFNSKGGMGQQLLNMYSLI